MEPPSFNLVRAILTSQTFRSQNVDQQQRTLDEIIATGEITGQDVFKLILEVQQQEARGNKTQNIKASDDQLNSLMGKGPNEKLSDRTKISLGRLYQYLANNYPDMELMETSDNGDCYYDAFSKSISLILGRIITIEDLRNMVSDYVNNPANDLSKVMRILKDNFNEFKNYVHEDYQMAKANGRNPVWGNTQIDGEILCRYFFNLNLREISEGFFDEGLKLQDGLAVETNRVAGDVFYQWASLPETRLNTVFIGNIPNHYLAIIPREGENILLAPNQPYIRKFQTYLAPTKPASLIRTPAEMSAGQNKFSPSKPFSLSSSGSLSAGSVQEEQEEWTEDDVIEFCDDWLEGTNLNDEESLALFLQYAQENGLNTTTNNNNDVNYLCGVFNQRRKDNKARKEAEAKRKGELIRQQTRQLESQAKQAEQQADQKKYAEIKRLEDVTTFYHELLGQAHNYLGAYYNQTYPQYVETLKRLYETELKYPSADYKTLWLKTIKSSFQY